MICSIVTFNLHYYCIDYTPNAHVICVILLLRWFVDCLDGCVAREYNKTSDFGGFLDTLNDILIITIIVYLWSLKVICNEYYCNIISICISGSIFAFMTVNNSLSHHKNICKSNHIINKIISFCIDNSIIGYVIIILLNYWFDILML